MHHILWPQGYLPGIADNFASNEVIHAGLDAAAVWPLLADATRWPAYYANAADVAFDGGAGPLLAAGTRFRFSTFGFPVEALVTECVPPAPGRPGRLAWHGWVEGDAAARLDVYHAWLLEDLDGGRVRVLTQETQNGAPARELARTRPNPMINGHQDWLDGLVGATRENDAGRALSDALLAAPRAGSD
ncbi:SRPBCC domain-containing protein [Massilia forsythiae]|nr:SRPBCC domain-containing protein [Massilia forsythiae]